MVTLCITAKFGRRWQRWVIFDRVQRCLPVGPFRFAPRADILPDDDSDIIRPESVAREREVIRELHFIGTTHHCGGGVWAATARLY
jgi:hypothetical protein